MAGKDGFLLKKNAEEFVETSNKGKPLSRGQVVQCLILGGADARSVPVTINPSRVCLAVLPATSTVILQSLLPGVLVNISLQEVSLWRKAQLKLLGCLFVVFSGGTKWSNWDLSGQF